METALAIFIILIVLIFILLLTKKKYSKKEKNAKSDNFIANYRMKNDSAPIVMFDNQFVNKIPENSIAVPSSMSAYRNLQVYDIQFDRNEKDPVLSYMSKTKSLLNDSELPSKINDREKMVSSLRPEEQ